MKIDNITTYLSSINNRGITRISLCGNESIIEQGSKADNIYYLVKGMIKAFNVNETGNEFLFGIFGNDEFFGELEFFTGAKYFNSVETITDCEIIKIPYAVFETMLKDDSDFFMDITKRLADRLLRISSRAVEYSYFPAEYLLSKFLYIEAYNKNAAFVFSKEDTANYLGLNIRTINRILKKFAGKNLITGSKNEIRITNLEELKNIFLSFNK